MLEAGADKVAVNSAALKHPHLVEELAQAFGTQFVVLAIDAKQFGDAWVVHLNGGRTPTDQNLFDWARAGQERGAGEILFTSMDHDGVKQGFACEALARLVESLRIPVIASGGAGSMAHFEDVFRSGKADAALAASIFHFGEIAIPELKTRLRQKGIPVRI